MTSAETFSYLIVALGNEANSLRKNEFPRSPEIVCWIALFNMSGEFIYVDCPRDKSHLLIQARDKYEDLFLSAIYAKVKDSSYGIPPEAQRISIEKFEHYIAQTD